VPIVNVGCSPPAAHLRRILVEYEQSEHDRIVEPAATAGSRIEHALPWQPRCFRIENRLTDVGCKWLLGSGRMPVADSYLGYDDRKEGAIVSKAAKSGTR
jgi:hypothetical protein